MQDYCMKTSSNVCFGYLLEPLELGDSNKYPNHMFCKEITIKQGISYISFWPLRILYNNEFILMATSLGTKAVVVTRGHYPSYIHSCIVFVISSLDTVENIL